MSEKLSDKLVIGRVEFYVPNIVLMTREEFLRCYKGRMGFDAEKAHDMLIDHARKLGLLKKEEPKKQEHGSSDRFSKKNKGHKNERPDDNPSEREDISGIGD